MSRILTRGAEVAGVSVGMLVAIFGWLSWPLATIALSEWWDIHWGWALLITALVPYFVPFGGLANLALAVYGIVLLLS